MNTIRNVSHHTLPSYSSPSSSTTSLDRLDGYKAIPQEPDLEAQTAGFEPLEIEQDSGGSSTGYSRTARTGLAIGGGTAAAILSPVISVPTGIANAFVVNFSVNNYGSYNTQESIRHNTHLATTIVTAVAAATLAGTAIGLGAEHKSTLTRATYSAACAQAGLWAGGLVGAFAGYMVQAGAMTFMSEKNQDHALPYAAAVGGIGLGLFSAAYGATYAWMESDG